MKTNLVTKILCAAIAAVAFGCGAVDDDIIEPTDDDGELGTLEQAMNIGNGGYGFANTSAKLACAQPGSLGQDCLMPRVTSIHVKYCIVTSGANPIPSDLATSLRSGVASLDGDLSAWDFAEVPSTQSTCQIKFLVVNSGQGNPGNDNIDSYVGWVPGGTITSLTSPAGVSHVNGTWRSFTQLDVRIDLARFTNFFIGGAAFVGNQVAGNSVAKFVGLGSQTSVSYNNSPTRRVLVFPITMHLTAGEKCRVNGVNTVTSPTTVSNTFGCGV